MRPSVTKADCKRAASCSPFIVILQRKSTVPRKSWRELVEKISRRLENLPPEQQRATRKRVARAASTSSCARIERLFLGRKVRSGPSSNFRAKSERRELELTTGGRDVWQKLARNGIWNNDRTRNWRGLRHAAGAKIRSEGKGRAYGPIARRARW